MNCERFEELITGAVDGELSQEEQRLLDDHLKSCQQCRSAYETELWFKKFVREKLAGRPAPADLVQSIGNVTRGESARAPSPGWADRLKEVLSVPLIRPALALGVLVIIGLLFLRGGSQGDVIEKSLAV